MRRSPILKIPNELNQGMDGMDHQDLGGGDDGLDMLQIDDDGAL